MTAHQVKHAIISDFLLASTKTDIESGPEAVVPSKSQRSDKDAKAASTPIAISNSPLKASKKPRVIEATYE